MFPVKIINTTKLKFSIFMKLNIALFLIFEKAKKNLTPKFFVNVYCISTRIWKFFNTNAQPISISKLKWWKITKQKVRKFVCAHIFIINYNTIMQEHLTGYLQMWIRLKISVPHCTCRPLTWLERSLLAFYVNNWPKWLALSLI